MFCHCLGSVPSLVHSRRGTCLHVLQQDLFCGTNCQYSAGLETKSHSSPGKLNILVGCALVWAYLTVHIQVIWLRRMDRKLMKRMTVQLFNVLDRSSWLNKCATMNDQNFLTNFDGAEDRRRVQNRMAQRKYRVYIRLFKIKEYPGWPWPICRWEN